MLFYLRWKKAFDDEQCLRRLPDMELVESVKRLPSTERHYCVECGWLVPQAELSSHSSEHTIRTNITDSQLRHPTSFLCPVDNRKSQAVSDISIFGAHMCIVHFILYCFTLQQFYFSDSSLKLLHSELKRLHFTNILCIGTPR